MQTDGFFGLWRKLFLSEIWKMPPVYLRVWLWILGDVQWKIYEAKTATQFVIYVLPGQKITSLNDIANGVSWDEWGKEKVPNRKTISTVLEWLQNRGQINAESNNRHTFISVVKWDTYQAQLQDKVTEKVTPNGHPMDSRTDSRTDTNKKDYKGRKVKTESKTLCVSPPEWMPLEAWNSFVNMRESIKKSLSDDGAKIAFNKLEKWKEDGHDIEEILNNSTMNKWQGLFGPKSNGNGKDRAPPKSFAQIAEDEMIQNMQRFNERFDSGQSNIFNGNGRTTIGTQDQVDRVGTNRVLERTLSVVK
jgi:predicted transcriptional regulator